MASRTAFAFVVVGLFSLAMGIIFDFIYMDFIPSTYKSSYGLGINEILLLFFGIGIIFIIIGIAIYYFSRDQES